MDTDAEHAFPLLLLTLFARALSHEVRTPLSVISNDLSYFKTMLPEGECERGLSRCREVAGILREASELGGTGVTAVPLSVQALLEGFETEASVALPINGDAALLPRAFRLIREAVPRQLRVPGSWRACSRVVDGGVEITLSLPLSDSGSIHDFSSLTEFLCRSRETDAYFAPFVDAIILAHGGRIRVRTGDELTIAIKLSRG